jgi:hypothetical protein
MAAARPRVYTAVLVWWRSLLRSSPPSCGGVEKNEESTEREEQMNIEAKNEKEER